MGFKNDENPITSVLVTTVLTQCHINKVIKKIGQPGLDVVVVELKQLHDRIVVDPRNSACGSKKLCRYTCIGKLCSSPISNVSKTKALRTD